MRRTRIKFCGVCRAEDAAFAAECGVDAIGMVFYPPSPRCVSTDQARAILNVVPPFVTPVGLFVDAPAEEILDTAKMLGLNTVQLHGDESPELIASLKPLKVLKAIRVEKPNFPAVLAGWKSAIRSCHLENLQALLLETANTSQAGGSGIANDWQTVSEAVSFNLFHGLPRLIAAGGLTPSTVGEVVRLLRPYAVDVSSGVEHVRRQKSREKMQAFIAAVRDAEGPGSGTQASATAGKLRHEGTK